MPAGKVSSPSLIFALPHPHPHSNTTATQILVPKNMENTDFIRLPAIALHSMPKPPSQRLVGVVLELKIAHRAWRWGVARCGSGGWGAILAIKRKQCR